MKAKHLCIENKSKRDRKVEELTFWEEEKNQHKEESKEKRCVTVPWNQGQLSEDELKRNLLT